MVAIVLNVTLGIDQRFARSILVFLYCFELAAIEDVSVLNSTHGHAAERGRMMVVPIVQPGLTSELGEVFADEVIGQGEERRAKMMLRAGVLDAPDSTQNIIQRDDLWVLHVLSPVLLVDALMI